MIFYDYTSFIFTFCANKVLLDMGQSESKQVTQPTQKDGKKRFCLARRKRQRQIGFC